MTRAEPVVIDIQPAAAPPMRHAVCGYVIRGAGGHGVRVAALCGEPTWLPLQSGGEKCGTCLMLAQAHGEACSCFKTWPDTARLPRPERNVVRRAGVSEEEAHRILERHGRGYDGYIPTIDEGRDHTHFDNGRWTT